ncbi:MAG: potassium channel protein [Candidatus Zixiibacteriota bacterium]|nr:MAG: potassium channel protein [candidate division Zixibacteria bacterium]
MAYHAQKSAAPTQKLLTAILFFIVLLSSGTIGFMFLEQMKLIDALYMTVITLSTVGFGEVTPLHPLGRAFVICLILVGMGAVAFMASTIGQIVVQSQLRTLLGRRKMQKGLRKLSGHFILAGYGRVGRQVAAEFKRQKVKFVVIEIDDKSIEDLQDEGLLYIRGMATDDDVLRDAGIDSARTLISTLPDEAQNVYLTLTARDMNADLNIIARADFEDGEKKLVRAGANHVVSPHVLGGQRMAMASLRPNVVDFMHMTLGDGGMSIEEMVIPLDSVFNGKSLAESGLKQNYGVNIVGIKKSNARITITPEPNTILETGDVLVLIGPGEGLEKLSKELN